MLLLLLSPVFRREGKRDLGAWLNHVDNKIPFRATGLGPGHFVGGTLKYQHL